MKKIKRVIEDVSQSQLFDVDAFADKLWQNYDIDVEFTRHFVDRVNDPRNGIPGINSAQLIRLLRKEYEKYGNDIANMDDGEEAVMKDTKTSVNMPFVMNTGRDGKKLIAKTIMKKKDFKTPDQEFVVNEVLDKPLPFTLVGNDYDRVLYAFETKDGVEASVSFELLEGMTEEEDVWEMSFTVDGKAAIPLDRSPNAYAVFATVASILSDFLRTHPEANNIAFNASIKEPSRIKLYDRLSKMMPKLGLKLDFVEQGSGTKYYQFSRVGTNLNEVLDKPMPYELIKKGHSYIYQFESQEGKMSEVTFKKLYDDDDDDYGSSSSGGTRWDMDFSVDGSWTIPTTKGSLGNALSVFATVTQILRDFIRTRRDAEIISFNASLDEPSRVKLYDRLASKMPQLGFKLDYSGDVHGNKYYKFRRVGTNLNEVLDKPVPYELIDDSYGNAIYEFRTENGKKCLVNFEMTEDEDNPSGANWEMNFTVDGKLTIPTTKGSLSNALSVFATVTQIMADFIRTHPEARTILFSAKLAEPSRVKLYDRLAMKMPQLGFKLDRSGDAHGYKIYLFRKVGTKLKENSSAGATCSGAIATASQPMGMLSRNGGGLLSGKPTNEPFPNTPDWIKKSVKQWKRQNKQLR